MYLMKQKVDTKELYLHFANFGDQQAGRCIRTVGSDRGGEYFSRDLENQISACITRRDFGVPYSSHRTCVAAHMKDTLLNFTRAII